MYCFLRFFKVMFAKVIFCHSLIVFIYIGVSYAFLVVTTFFMRFIIMVRGDDDTVEVSFI